MMAANNLHNIAVHTMRGVLSCHQDGAWIPEAELLEGQLKAFNLANEAVAKVAATRSSKNVRKAAHNAKAEPRDQKAASRIFPLFGAPGSSPWAVLDDSVIDQACRLHRDPDGSAPFLALGSQEAPLVVRGAKKPFVEWRPRLAAWLESGRQGKRPGMPKYSKKGGLKRVEFDGKSFNRAGGALPPLTLADGTARPLFLDREKKTPLGQAAIDAWHGLRASGLLSDFRSILGLAAGEGEFRQMRIVAKARSIWLEGVFEVMADVPDASFLGRAIAAEAVVTDAKRAKAEAKKAADLARRDEALAAAGKPPIAAKPPSPKAKLPVLVHSEKNEAWARVLAAACEAGAMPSCMAIDLGVNNLATLCFSNGSPAVVISAGAIGKTLSRKDAAIDARISRLATPEIRALQAKESKGGASDGERGLLRGLLRAIESDGVLSRMRERRARWLDNALHQASRGIAHIAKARGVEAVVVGRNVGWKDGSDMGSAENRRFHVLPHARLIQMLAYKHFDAGIMQIEVEESHTSITSFAANEALRSIFDKAQPPKPSPAAKAALAAGPFARECAKGKKKAHGNAAEPAIPISALAEVCPGVRKAAKGKEKANGNAAESAITTSALAEVRPGVRKAAKRGGPKHLFHTPRQGRWTNIHADANGAYNIMRRACPGFARHARLSSAFTLLGVGPQGLHAIPICPNLQLPAGAGFNRAKLGLAKAEPQ